MKFTCEIEVECIDEEDNIDDAVKRELVRKIVSQVKEKTFAPIIDAAAVSMKEKTDVLVEETIAKFMAKKIVITDKWGNVKESYGNVDELLQDKFDNYILEPVDQNGKGLGNDTCGYSNNPRIMHEIDTRIKKAVESYSSRILKNVDSKINDLLNKSLAEKVSQTLVKKIDLRSVIES